jgi:hypothetical protein
MKLHLISSLNPAVTACGRGFQPSDNVATSQRSLFRRRRNAKPGEACVWCGRVDDADARREQEIGRG